MYSQNNAKAKSSLTGEWYYNYIKSVLVLQRDKWSSRTGSNLIKIMSIAIGTRSMSNGQIDSTHNQQLESKESYILEKVWEESLLLNLTETSR